MKSATKAFATVLAIAVPMTLAASVQADWVTVEDWQAPGLLGNEPTVGNWKHNTSAGNGTIVTDPAGSGDQVLLMEPNSAVSGSGYYLNFPAHALPDNAVSTLFFAAYSDGGQLHIRVTDKDTVGGSWYNDDRAAVAMTADPQISGSAVSANQWYAVWMVIDLTSAGGTYDVYVAPLSGGSPTLATDDHAMDIVGGDVTPDALDTIMIIEGANHTGNQKAYVGDILVDTTGTNLTNPIPEPATIALMAIGGLVSLRRRG